jgi:PTH1 family peptidyl-tRNA hydrolase
MAIEVILGLGNPGKEYADTRHNVGFCVIERVAQRHGVRAWIDRCSSELAVVAVGRLVVLARPLTFMNRSGEAARQLLAELEVAPESMLVVVDDVDLPLSSLRLRRSGGPGTHNGLRDLCEKVGTGFPRLRVGVRGDDLSDDLADYVLSPFADSEIDIAHETIERAADAVESTLGHEFESVMNVFNRPSNDDRS